MVQTLIKRKKIIEKVKTDIIFCVDISDSMMPCIEGIEQNIKKFLNTIEDNQNIKIEWRLGLLGHQYIPNDNVVQDYGLAFTFDIDSFLSKLGSLKAHVGWDEANLIAIDMCLDYSWERNAHKFVIMFTNEPVETGWNPEDSIEKIDELMQKIQDLGVSLQIVSFKGEEFNLYRKIASVDKCHYIAIEGNNDFNGVGFDKLMEKIGQSVNSCSRGVVSKQKIVKKNIFGLTYNYKYYTKPSGRGTDKI